MDAAKYSYCRLSAESTRATTLQMCFYFMVLTLYIVLIVLAFLLCFNLSIYFVLHCVCEIKYILPIF